MEYTKGAWEFNKFDLTIRIKEWRNSATMGDYRGCIIADMKPAIGAESEQDIAVAKQVHVEGWRQTEANAHLIAAAPDMYEALKNIIERHTQGLALGETLDLAPGREALAKAEGRVK